MTSSAIKVILADSQYLIRMGLRSLITQDNHIEIVGESKSGDELLEMIKKHQPDVVTLDYKSNGTFNLEIIREIRLLSPATNVLIVSSDENRERIFKAIEYGINSFVTKECSEQEIRNAIIATSKNEKFFCNKILDVILAKHIHKEDDCEATELTVREIEIVKLIADGNSTKEIAAKLNLSHHTIYTHRKNVMKKLNIKSASELILYAINTGIVKPRVETPK